MTFIDKLRSSKPYKAAVGGLIGTYLFTAANLGSFFQPSRAYAQDLNTIQTNSQQQSNLDLLAKNDSNTSQKSKKDSYAGKSFQERKYIYENNRLSIHYETRNGQQGISFGKNIMGFDVVLGAGVNENKIRDWNVFQGEKPLGYYTTICEKNPDPFGRIFTPTIDRKRYDFREKFYKLLVEAKTDMGLDLKTKLESYVKLDTETEERWNKSRKSRRIAGLAMTAIAGLTINYSDKKPKNEKWSTLETAAGLMGLTAGIMGPITFLFSFTKYSSPYGGFYYYHNITFDLYDTQTGVSQYNQKLREKLGLEEKIDFEEESPQTDSEEIFKEE